MNNENKTFLARYRTNKALIDRLNDKIKRLDERASAIRMSNVTGMPRGSNGVSNFDFIDEKHDLEARVQRLTERGKIIKAEIVSAIDELEDPRYADVLELYFLECHGFIDIAAELGYSERHVRRLYVSAVNAIIIGGQDTS